MVLIISFSKLKGGLNPECLTYLYLELLSFKVSVASRHTSITIPLGRSRFLEGSLSRLLFLMVYTNYSCLMATDEIDLRFDF